MAKQYGLTWSAQLILDLSPRGTRLPGDKIILPQKALEELLSASAKAGSLAAESEPGSPFDPWNPRAHASWRQEHADDQQRLPQPLTFRLVNPENGRIAYAGIQEFSAEDEQIVVSPFLQEALGLDRHSHGLKEQDEEAAKGPAITIHAAQLQKGTYVKLRPLEAGYDVEDWKSLLERHMRANFTTLTKGEVLKVPGEAGLGGTPAEFRFLVDDFKPDMEAICVVDTDLEVDIEALNEEQARETVKKIATKFQNTNGEGGQTQAGGDLDLFKESAGQVMPGQYVDYRLPSWPRDQALDLVLTPASEDTDVDLLASPSSSRQRARPRADEYVFADFEDRPSKRLRLQPTNIEMEEAEALYVSVYAFEAPPSDSGKQQEAPSGPRRFTLRAQIAIGDEPSGQHVGASDGSAQTPNPEDVRCKNCGQWIPQRTLMLHENFCLRNNILCPQGCGQVFQKRSEAFEKHWHCPHDTFFGNTAVSHSKHDTLYHPTSPLHCTRCSTTQTFSSIPLLAQHHTTTCPAKLILCRFCHLTVPQEGDPDEPNHEALLSDLTVHELNDGSRTTECHLCNRITRMRDMDTHMKHHDLERKSCPRPRVCRNVLCGNTLDGATHAGSTRTGKDAGNEIGLCGACFAPLYVTLFDPEGKALRRRIERRYLQQLMTGCGKSWCQNSFCRTGRKNTGLDEEGTSAKTAVPMARPFVEGAVGGQTPFNFCVEEGCQRRRERALMLEAESEQRLGKKGYAFVWCVAALEAESGDLEKARGWLENWAPRVEEERM